MWADHESVLAYAGQHLHTKEGKRIAIGIMCTVYVDILLLYGQQVEGVQWGILVRPYRIIATIKSALLPLTVFCCS